MAAEKKSKVRGKRKKSGSKLAKKRKTPSKHPASRLRSAIRKSAKRNKKVRGVPALVEVVSFEPRGLGSSTAGQAGDLQGLSGAQRSASESVEELLEEGNSFEAGFVKGVEDADDAEEAEVETHEVPEDDVPEEYFEQR